MYMENNCIANTVHALLEQAAHDAIGIRANYKGGNEIYAVKMSTREIVVSVKDMDQSGWQAHALLAVKPRVVVTHHGQQRHEFWKDKGTVTSYWEIKDNSRLVRR